MVKRKTSSSHTLQDKMENTTVTDESGSGLAGEIDRPQVLFYPLIESSNIPRYN
jgi:hypothetical protein